MEQEEHVRGSTHYYSTTDSVQDPRPDAGEAKHELIPFAWIVEAVTRKIQSGLPRLKTVSSIKSFLIIVTSNQLAAMTGD